MYQSLIKIMNEKWLVTLIVVLLLSVTGVGLYLVISKSVPKPTKVSPLDTIDPVSPTPTIDINNVEGPVGTTPGKPFPTTAPTNTPPPVPTVVPTILPNGLKIEDLQPGQGKEVKSGDTIKIHYLGTLTNGTKFDSSYDRGQPFQTQIGVGQVIKGWDEGVVGMKVGGKRRLTIPPELGYGAQGAGSSIPPNATLIFEVELVEIL